MAYSKVERSTWNDEKFRRWPRDTRDAWLFILTGEHMNRIGCFVLDQYHIASAVQISLEAAEQAIQQLVAEGRIAYDPDTRLMLVLRHFKHNVPENPNVAKSAANDDLAELPFSDRIFTLLLRAVEFYLPLQTKNGDPYCSVIADAVRERLRNGAPKDSGDPFADLTSNPSPNPSANRLGKGMPIPEPEPEPEPEVSGPDGPSSNSAAPKSDAPPIEDQLWEVWLEVLGGPPPHPKLSTGKRRTSLRLLYQEQLRREDDPLETFRRICEAVRSSEHHMSHRAYQLPESLFRNPERRERWYLQAVNPTGSAGGGGIVQDILELLEAAGSDVLFAATRELAFDRAEEWAPEAWARAGPVFRQLEFQSLFDLKRRGNRRDLEKEIREQLGRIRPAAA